ncbi:biotin/lipoyl-containing protein [Pseudoalteromonas sp. ZZD1]|uniref:biotin/lipoyl-containing protein n=1 Tax=Pseudoalteromonas sp. ZZD1 TaxID=3139395 RepID=UPI003BAAA5BD
MNREVKIPTLPDSVSTAKITNLYVNEGKLAYVDDVLFDVETDKVVLEVMADCNGIIENITIANGDAVTGEQVVMTIKQLADSELPARPTVEQPQPRVSDSEENATVSPWLSKLNKSLIIALAVGGLAILYVLGK